MKHIVWFEPERVHPGTWLAENHPEWIHGGKNGGLLRLDDPGCRKWLTEHIDGLLTSQKIDLYRQDFNIDPPGLLAC
jgi:alpha-galactosidase